MCVAGQGQVCWWCCVSSCNTLPPLPLPAGLADSAWVVVMVVVLTVVLKVVVMMAVKRVIGW